MSEEALVRIVVGDDFEAPGRLAIQEALRRGRNAHLHVCHVLAPASTDEMDAKMTATGQKLWERIGDVGVGVLGLTAADISIHVRFGKPAECLEQVAADYDADLIIVGTTDEKGLKSLGSVATHLIHSASCSVLVARNRNHAGVAKTERPEPPTPNADIHEERHELGLMGTQRVSWNPAGGKGNVRMF